MTAAASLPFVDFLPPPGDDLQALARRFVAWFLRRWPGLASHAQDLEQEAALGALVASKRFDPRRGAGFVTHAWWGMRGQVTRYLRRAFDRPHFLQQLAQQAPPPHAQGEPPQSPGDAGTVEALLRPVLLEATRPRRRRVYPRALGASAERDVELFLAHLGGQSLAEAGRRFGISRERARLVVEKLKPAFERWRASLRQRG